MKLTYQSPTYNSHILNGGVFKGVSLKRKAEAILAIQNIAPEEIFSLKALSNKEVLLQEYSVLKKYWEEQKSFMKQTEIEDAILSRLELCFTKLEEILDLIDESKFQIQTKINEIVEGKVFSELIRIFPALGFILYKIITSKFRLHSDYLVSIKNAGNVSAGMVTESEEIIGNQLIHALSRDNTGNLQRKFPKLYLLITSIRTGKIIPISLTSLLEEISSEEFFLIVVTTFESINKEDFHNPNKDHILRHVFNEIAILYNLILSGECQRAKNRLLLKK